MIDDVKMLDWTGLLGDIFAGSAPTLTELLITMAVEKGKMILKTVLTEQHRNQTTN
jgi:hypothetical protein